MSIHVEGFDGSLVLPSDTTWAAPYSVTNAPPSPIAPVSSPNCLLFTHTGAATQYAGTYNTLDGNSGNVAMSGAFQPASLNAAVFVFVRIRVNAAVDTYYEAQFKWTTAGTASIALFRVVSGASTQLGSTVLAGTGSAVGWCVPSVSADSGNTISASVQRLSDGEWLSSLGSWQIAQTAAITVADTSPITGQGYSGIAIQATGDDVCADDLSLDPVATPPPPLPFVGHLAAPARGLATRPPVPALRPPATTHRTPPILTGRTALGHATSRPAARIALPPAAAKSAPRIVPSHPRPPDGRPGRPPGRRILPPLRPPAPPPAPTPTPWGIGGGQVRSRSDEDRRTSPPGPGGASRLSALPVVDPPPIPGPAACGCCVKCKCQVTVCVQGCGGATIPGAQVQVKDGGGTVVAACVTPNTSGCCTLCLGPGAGTYTVVVSAQGYTTSTTSQTFACGDAVTITLTPIGATPPCYQFIVAGCCGIHLAGITITIDGGTITTGPTGEVTWCAPGPGTYPYTVNGTCGLGNVTGTITVANCSYTGNMITVALPVLSGYACGFNGGFPTPTTLSLTDSVHGAATLTYDSTVGSPTQGTYVGTTPGCTYPATPCVGTVLVDGSTSYTGCPASTGFTIDWKLSPTPNCGPPILYGSAKYAFCGTCDNGFGGWNGGLVPDDAPGPTPCGPTTLPVPTITNCTVVSPCASTCWAVYTCTFVNPTGCGPWPAILGGCCPFDITYAIAANPPAGSGVICSGAMISPGASCPCAIWTNFGPGTVTVSA